MKLGKHNESRKCNPGVLQTYLGAAGVSHHFLHRRSRFFKSQRGQVKAVSCIWLLLLQQHFLSLLKHKDKPLQTKMICCADKVRLKWRNARRKCTGFTKKQKHHDWVNYFSTKLWLIAMWVALVTCKRQSALWMKQPWASSSWLSWACRMAFSSATRLRTCAEEVSSSLEYGLRHASSKTC